MTTYKLQEILDTNGNTIYKLFIDGNYQVSGEFHSQIEYIYSSISPTDTYLRTDNKGNICVRMTGKEFMEDVEANALYSAVVNWRKGNR